MPKNKDMQAVTLPEEVGPGLSISSWHGAIRVEFNSSVESLVMTPEQAIDFAKALFLRATAERMIK